MPYKDPAKLAAYKKAYREKNRQYFRDAHNKWSKANPEKNYARRLKYLSTPENRKKNAARSAVYRAVRNGLLVRPTYCSACLNDCKPEADHADYDKPLEVVWLCKSCHVKAGMKRL